MSEKDFLNQVESLAKSLLHKHGLDHDWTFKFNRMVNNAGLCKHSVQTIFIGKPYATFVRDIEAVKNTLLHEIAHAIAGPRHGHDEVWRQIFLRIGGNGKAKTKLPNAKEYFEHNARWMGVCPVCGKQYPAQRKPRRDASCYSCNPEAYDERYKIVYTRIGQTF